MGCKRHPSSLHLPVSAPYRARVAGAYEVTPVFLWVLGIRTEALKDSKHPSPLSYLVCLSFSFYEIEFDVVQGGPALTVQPQRTLTFWSSCLRLPCAGITGVRPHTWLSFSFKNGKCQPWCMCCLLKGYRIAACRHTVKLYTPPPTPESSVVVCFNMDGTKVVK